MFRCLEPNRCVYQRSYLNFVFFFSLIGHVCNWLTTIGICGADCVPVEIINNSDLLPTTKAAAWSQKAKSWQIFGKFSNRCQKRKLGNEYNIPGGEKSHQILSTNGEKWTTIANWSRGKLTIRCERKTCQRKDKSEKLTIGTD